MNNILNKSGKIYAFDNDNESDLLVDDFFKILKTI